MPTISRWHELIVSVCVQNTCLSYAKGVLELPLEQPPATQQNWKSKSELRMPTAECKQHHSLVHQYSLAQSGHCPHQHCHKRHLEIYEKGKMSRNSQRSMSHLKATKSGNFFTNSHFLKSRQRQQKHWISFQSLRPTAAHV